MGNLLKEELAKKAAKNETPKQETKGGTVLSLIQQMLPQVKMALPSHLNPERLIRIVATEIRRNPDLLSCSKESLLGALMLSAQLGLEPGPLGLCYYVPYKREVEFIIGYKGMIDLARRSGQISVIYAETVYENDKTFDYQLGLEPKLIHVPSLDKRGKPFAWYGVCKFKDGGYYLKVMGREDVEKHRKRSPSASSSHSPWNTDYEQMAKKTVIREMFKYLPVSSEMLEIGLPDGGIVRAREQAGEMVVDVDFLEEPSETPQTKNEKNESQNRESHEDQKKKN